MKILAFGTFDYFHAGHESYLKQASKLGTEQGGHKASPSTNEPFCEAKHQLIVVVARDTTVQRIKGKKPDHSQRQRLKHIKSLKYVTKAVLGNREDKFKVVRQHKPDIIALGYDQFVFTYQLKKVLIQNKLNTKIVRLEPFQPEINKSSIIKTKNRVVATVDHVAE